MKLLFDLESSNIYTEFKNVLGFIDANFEVPDLRMELEDACYELSKIIGKQTYKFISEAYWDNEQNEDIQKLILKAQSVVANQAYRTYAPKSDLAATNQGRLMRADEQHKAPFEWMIDRDNEEKEKTYYKQLDYLIEYLDELNPTVKKANGEDEAVKWKDTQTYKNSCDIFFRTADDFREYFPIESRYLLMKLAPGIRKVKREQLEPRMGKTALQSYVTAKQAGTDVPNEEMYESIKAACAYLTLSWGFKRLNATLFPSGVLQKYSSIYSNNTKQPPKNNEVGVIAELFERDGYDALRRIEEMTRPEPIEELPLYDIDIEESDGFVST